MHCFPVNIWIDSLIKYLRTLQEFHVQEYCLFVTYDYTESSKNPIPKFLCHEQQINLSISVFFQEDDNGRRGKQKTWLFLIMHAQQHCWVRAVPLTSIDSLIHPLFGSFSFLMWWKQYISYVSLAFVDWWKVWSAPPVSVLHQPTSLYCFTLLLLLLFSPTMKRLSERDGLNFTMLCVCVCVFDPLSLVVLLFCFSSLHKGQTPYQTLGKNVFFLMF